MFPRTHLKHSNREYNTWKSPIWKKNGLGYKKYKKKVSASLDHVLVHQRWRLLVKKCKAMPYNKHISDHKLIISTIKLKFPSKLEEKRRKKSVCMDFMDDLSLVAKVNQEMGEVLCKYHRDDGTIQDLDAYIQAFNKVLFIQAKKYKKKKKIETAQISTQETQHLWRTKRSERAKKQVNEDLQKRWSLFGKSLSEKSVKYTPREFYTLLRRFIGQHPRKVNTDANEFAKKLETKCGKKNTQTVPLYLETTQWGEKLSAPTTEEIMAIASTMKNHKTPGYDGIPAEIWKMKDFAQKLQKIIQSIINRGHIPEAWKNTIICPIPKPNSKDYRPITLLCTGYKIYTKWLYKKIQKNIVETAGSTQAGFMPKRSTYDHINYLRRVREHAIEYRKEIWIVLADVKSAFDTVNRESLFMILKNAGVSREIIQLFKDSMNNLRNEVHTKFQSSKPVMFQNGVPQGGPASGPLFTMPIAHALSSLKQTHKEFADDILLLLQKIEDIGPTLQYIVDELEKVGMKLAANKYEVYHIDKNGNECIYDVKNENFMNPNWHKSLKRSQKKSIRYLGDYIGPSEHAITPRIMAAERAYNLLRNKLWGHKCIDEKTKINVFKAIVMSTLLYGMKTHSISQTKMKRFNWFCLRKLKSIMGKSHNEHISYAMMNDTLKNAEIKWKWPDQLIRKQRLKFFIQQMHKTDIKEILLPQPNLKRKRGGPKRRMIDAIQEDISILYDPDIRYYDYNKHGIEKKSLAEKILYFCHLHEHEIIKTLEMN